jgi:nitrogen-specific signal transduction histidine kinase
MPPEAVVDRLAFHRGDIEFSTQPGRTVFRVRLPAAGAKVMTGGI